MRDFFYKYWGLYYLLFFLLLGLLIFALLWKPEVNNCESTINDLNKQLEECRLKKQRIDTINIVNNPTDSSTIKRRVNCDAVVNSGGQGVTNTQHDLGEAGGTVIIEYNMNNIPDELTVLYDNTVVARSVGSVSGTGSVQFQYTPLAGKPNYCVVNISAPNNGTTWSYLLNCPQ